MLRGSDGYEPAGTPSGVWHDDQSDQVQVDYHRMESRRHRRATLFSGRKGALLKALMFLVIFFVGMVLGFALRPNIREQVNRTKFAYKDGYEGYSSAISSQLTRLLSVTKIKENLKRYTEHVHITATQGNEILRAILWKEMKEYGLQLKEAKYNVLLSYPDWERENTVSLLDGNRTVQYTSQYAGPVDEKDPELRHTYNAFSPNGSAQGDLVFANYGRQSDFDVVNQNGVTCRDNIVIMRYGFITPSLKVRNAERCGAAGVIFYSDPADVASSRSTFPDTWWLPGWATQRGSVLPSGGGGDPLTPSFPSVDGVPRIARNKTNLPTIPVQVIGYNDAQHIMSFMDGPLSNDTFHGNLNANVTYQLGPGYKAVRKGWKVRIISHNEMEQRQITNIIGVVEGSEEPDRFVVIGCHYDAWLYGGAGSTGTAILMELARIFGYMATKKEWRPRRTIVFAHWDASEQGVIGSTEWVQEHMKELAGHTVAYINLDSAVAGNYTLDVEADPLLHSLLVNISKKMMPPLSAKEEEEEEEQATMKHSLYHRWLGSGGEIQYPRGDSDHASFVRVGVPTIWPKFVHENHRAGFHLPGYHSTIDTFGMVSRYVDPSFGAHKVMAHFVMETLLRLSATTKLPFDCRQLSTRLVSAVETFKTEWTAYNDTDGVLKRLHWAVGNFSTITTEFERRVQASSINNVLETRKFNDQLMKLSTAFVHSDITAGWSQPRNILYSASEDHRQLHAIFADIGDAMKADMPVIQRAERLSKQVAIAMLAVQSASRMLSPSAFV